MITAVSQQDRIGFSMAYRYFLSPVAWMSRISGWFSAAMIFAAVLITFQMIFVRFVMNGSTVWQTEAIVYLVVAATLIGLPFVQLLRGHVNVDLVPISLPPKARIVLTAITDFLSIAIVALMLWYGFEYWHFAFQRGWTSDSIWGVRLWIPYASLPIGFGLLLLQLIADLVTTITGQKQPFGQGAS